MIKKRREALTALILVLVAMALLIFSLYSVIVKSEWSQGVYFLVSAYCIYPYDHKIPGKI